ncbi:hypothetical protein JW890_06795 [candidate division WOR-3 bacterium]|nr:hypothetical protein [candidate division WOR-3 bacterium]
MKILFLSLLLIPVSLLGKTYISSNYFCYLLDLAVVITGVTAAFLLNSAWEKLKSRKLERKYLDSFRDDIKQDLFLAEETLDQNRKRYDRAKSYLETLKEGKNNPEACLEIFKDIAAINQFSPKTSTYMSIVNSGNLSIIRDYKLKEKLFQYYQSFDELKLKEKILNDFTFDTAIPFIYKNIDLLNNRFITDESIQCTDFTNIFIGYNALQTLIFNAYKGLKDSSEKLLEELQGK